MYFQSKKIKYKTSIITQELHVYYYKQAAYIILAGQLSSMSYLSGLTAALRCPTPLLWGVKRFPVELDLVRIRKDRRGLGECPRTNCALDRLGSYLLVEVVGE